MKDPFQERHASKMRESAWQTDKEQIPKQQQQPQQQQQEQQQQQQQQQQQPSEQIYIQRALKKDLIETHHNVKYAWRKLCALACAWSTDLIANQAG